MDGTHRFFAALMPRTNLSELDVKGSSAFIVRGRVGSDSLDSDFAVDSLGELAHVVDVG